MFFQNHKTRKRTNGDARSEGLQANTGQLDVQC